MLYGTASVIQVVKLFNFLSHMWTHKTHQNWYHWLLSLTGALFSAISCCILLANAAMLLYYQHVGEDLIDLYNCIVIVLLLPLLHFMVLNQQSRA